MIESIPAAELIDPSPFGRGPGRRKATPEQVRARKDRKNEAERLKRATANGATASVKPQRASTRKASTRAASLKTEIAAFLTLANTIVIMSPLGTRPIAAMADASIPAERVGDELDDGEINALAAAIDAQCRRSPRFRKYVEGALSVGAGGQLVTILGIIATRRAARHGIVPGGQALDFALGMMVANGDTSALGAFVPGDDAPTGPDPETAETPPAPVPEGGFEFDKT